MAEEIAVPVRVRRVANELRELRRRCGLTGDEVAQSLGMSAAKLSRLERGYRGLRPDDVSALLGLYRVPVQRRDELLAIVRGGGEPNWWNPATSQPGGNWRMTACPPTGRS